MSSMPQQKLPDIMATLREEATQGVWNGDEYDLIRHDNCKSILVCILLQQPCHSEQLRCALCIAACRE